MSLDAIEHIVIVMLENRSFDHMLGYLSLPSAGQMRVEGLKAGDWLDLHANLHGGVPFPPNRLDPSAQELDDPPHSWETIRGQIDTPAQGAARLGGFVNAYAAKYPDLPPEKLAHVMGYYDQAAVPIYDFFARNFAVCDHWFAALPAGTQPNRLMAMSGESQLAENSGLALPSQRLVYDWLHENEVDWCAYQWGAYFPFFTLDPKRLPGILTSLTLTPGSGYFRRYTHFAKSWTGDGKMPAVIFVEPEYGDGPHSAPNDDHPPTGVAQGQVFLADIYSTLISNSARWAKTLMLVTYDEHGGFFDHVTPLGGMNTNAGDQVFTTTGVRVPAFIISPLVDAGTVVDAKLDHTSILQLLADRFTPGKGYSAQVAARQAKLGRISTALKAPADPPRAPQIPHETKSALRGVAAMAPIAPQVGAKPADPPNARALHAVALKAMSDYADLMRDPAWAAVRNYVEQTRP